MLFRSEYKFLHTEKPERDYPTQGRWAGTCGHFSTVQGTVLQYLVTEVVPSFSVTDVLKQGELMNQVWDMSRRVDSEAARDQIGAGTT